MGRLLDPGFGEKSIPVRGTLIMFSMSFFLALFLTVYVEVILLSLT